jgi:hypothetical protein
MLWNVCGLSGEDELGKKRPIRRVFRFGPGGEPLDGDNMDKHGDDSSEDGDEEWEELEDEEDDYLDDDGLDWGDEQ